MGLINLGHALFVIEPGMGIAQLIFAPVAGRKSSKSSHSTKPCAARAGSARRESEIRQMMYPYVVHLSLEYG